MAHAKAMKSRNRIGRQPQNCKIARWEKPTLFRCLFGSFRTITFSTMKCKTTFAHSSKLGKAVRAAAKADGRNLSSYIRRVLEKELAKPATP